MTYKGFELTILRPICWVIGHRNYHWAGEGWTRTKFKCQLCGARTGVTAKREMLNTGKDELQ